MICGQRISGALEPTQAFQSFNCTALTRLRAWCGTVVQVRLKGTPKTPPVQSCAPKVTPGPVLALHFAKPITLYPSMDSKPSSVTTESLGAPLVVTVSLCHFVPVHMVGAVCICLPHSPWICAACVSEHIQVHIKGRGGREWKQPQHLCAHCSLPALSCPAFHNTGNERAGWLQETSSSCLRVYSFIFI